MLFTWLPFQMLCRAEGLIQSSVLFLDLCLRILVRWVHRDCGFIAMVNEVKVLWVESKCLNCTNFEHTFYHLRQRTPEVQLPKIGASEGETHARDHNILLAFLLCANIDLKYKQIFLWRCVQVNVILPWADLKARLAMPNRVSSMDELMTLTKNQKHWDENPSLIRDDCL